MIRVVFFIAIVVGIVIVHAYVIRPSPEVVESDHFDGERFFNLEPIEHGFDLLIKWLMNRDRGPWLENQHVELGPAPVERVNGDDLLVTLVGHATLLIQTGGLNILTDPIWAERAGPFSFLGSARVRPPAIRFEDLPPIDLVLVSHGHYDHMNIATLKRLYNNHKPQFLLPLGQGGYLRRAGIEGITELDWWQSVSMPNIASQVWLVPARHWTARWIGDQNRALWGGFVIETDSGPIYFAGDTGYGEHFKEIATRLGAPRLAILPVGAYRPAFFMSDVHTGPEDALLAHQDMQANTSLAMHFGTFPLGDDGQTEAIDQLNKLVGLQPTTGDSAAKPFLIPAFGFAEKIQ